jgi:hypothetical protein
LAETRAAYANAVKLLIVQVHQCYIITPSAIVEILADFNKRATVLLAGLAEKTETLADLEKRVEALLNHRRLSRRQFAY